MARTSQKLARKDGAGDLRMAVPQKSRVEMRLCVALLQQSMALFLRSLEEHTL
jgi:hypothetical protein